MKKHVVLLVMSSIALTGCGSKEDAAAPKPPAIPKKIAPAATDTSVAPLAPTEATPPPPPAPGTTAAPDPGQPASAAETATDASAKLTDRDIQNLNYAVNMYKTEFGHYPKSLEDMLGTKHLARVPVAGSGQKLSYDPQTGVAKLEGK